LQLMNKEKPEDDKESHEAPLVKPEIDEVWKLCILRKG
jgi:hypothetical protein